MTLTFGSLFAGIGGMDLGLERAGMVCKWQVEIDPYASRVLARHWPDVRRHDDVRTFPPGDPDGWRVDVITGGFPCQDVSTAGKRTGIGGARSGLWSEYSRIVREIRPRFVLVENVPGLLVSGLGRVLGDLAEGGYDAEWDCVPAAAVGAPHLRDRVFVLAYPQRQRGERRREPGHLAAEGGTAQGETRQRQRRGHAANNRRPALADAPSQRRPPQRAFDPGDTECLGEKQAPRSRAVLDPELRRPWVPPKVFCPAAVDSLARVRESRGQRGEWLTEPGVGRVADGVPGRVDRLRALGNSVVPQVAEWIGRRIIESVTRDTGGLLP